MTDQSQPDRQDGDGLLPCPHCKKPPGQKVGPPAMARCITENCLGKTLAAVPVTHWNASATRDAAEGAGGDAALARENYWRNLEGRDPATQQPAPDAMRDAMQAIADLEPGTQQWVDDVVPESEVRLIAGRAINVAKVALAAHVPPADGARQPKAPHCPNDGDPRCCYPNCECPRSPSATGAAEPVPLADHDEIGRKVLSQPWDIQKAIVTIAAHCTALTDQCQTGAVADLAGCISQGCLELANALATPPVRGDREAMRWYLACQNDGLFIINSEPRPPNDDQWHDRPDGPSIVLNVTELPEAKAIKIVGVMNDLSLPVRPGAGEREQALRDEIFCLREVVRGVRILDNAGRFKEYDGELWLRRVRNIGLDHDPVEFNRQPPQSSREG